MAFLEVNGLSKSYGQTAVLRDITFSLEKGDVLAIIGSSGSGKTTLLRCLNSLVTPDSGTIAVNGEVLIDASAPAPTDAELRRRRLHFGLVFQQFNLFPQYTVMQNLTLAPTLALKEALRTLPRAARHAERERRMAEITARAEGLLRRVGLENRRDAYPCELSGGQQQRVAIARALGMDPDVLCFDEPTSALDPELTGEVLRVIRGLKGADSTMVVVTHEMEFARSVADVVIFMADGVIAEMGAPEELFGNPQTGQLKHFLSRTEETV